jgi:hypothetical protein
MMFRNPMNDSAFPFAVGPNETHVNGLTKAEHAAIEIMTSLLATGKYDMAIDESLIELKFHTKLVLETLEEIFEKI